MKNGVQLIASGLRSGLPVLPSQPATLSEMYQQAPKWQKENWGKEEIPIEAMEIIRQELITDNIACAGDGSVLMGRASHEWDIFRKNDFELIRTNSADVGGGPRDVDSLPDLAANVTYYTDSDNTVLNSARQHIHDVSSVLENDIDATIEMTRIKKKSKIQFSLMHVPGHPEREKHKKNTLR